MSRLSYWDSLFWKSFLYRDAVRIAKKNNPNWDEESEEVKQQVIEMLMEDLDDKYRE